MTVVREISPDQFKVLENVPTQRGARTFTITNRRPAFKPCTFMVLDVASIK